MMEEILVGIDVGTTKVCTLVGRVEDDKSIRILGVGIEPSEGIRKGVIVDLAAASQAITRSVKKAESTSGLEITSALVSMAGAHVSSVNSRGAVAVNGAVIEQYDIEHALDQARAVAIPYDREIIHVIQRGFNIDGQDGIRNPKGLAGTPTTVSSSSTSLTTTAPAPAASTATRKYAFRTRRPRPTRRTAEGFGVNRQPGATTTRSPVLSPVVTSAD